eukprot:TRINITY_DN4493_c0_g1_i2.p2 TRINITY_DN4493_c0_g1~~TRINITY_DN4493_c0_g1_i2.p2  ORF type:complete len:137 (-),score=18.86 TRINITY_DN4493_c0_g1_i2:294-704(-)
MASRVMDLVRDIANPSEQDPFFPITRHKDWYTGHWAQGLQFTQDAKNQESSSESVNTYYAVYLYGLTSGQKYVPNVGRLLLATEINSVRTYWHMTPIKAIFILLLLLNSGWLGFCGLTSKDRICSLHTNVTVYTNL